MNSNMIFSLCSFFYILLTIVLYFTKPRIRNIENKIYSILIITNIIGLTIELGSTLLNTYLVTGSELKIFSLKLIMIYFLTWLYIFTVYIYYISERKENVVKNKLIPLVLVLFIAIDLTLPIYPKYENGVMAYTYGGCVDFVYAISFVLIIINLFLVIKNFKNIKSKKYIPLLVFMILGIISAILQSVFPQLLILASVETFVVVVMYFTIENPDMKMLKEMHDAKEISDNANEEKTLFLYNMTQEIRETTKNIDNEADIIIDSDNLSDDKESARNIKGETSKFRMMTNDIFDISAVEASSIKIYNNKYNLKLLLKTIISSYTDICQNKNIEFRTNIEHNIPTALYGDSISLKKVLSLILTNSLKYTDKGYIEMDVNTIIKNNICRLIFTIEDSGPGIKSSELEKIRINNKNLNEAYKMITLMNGTMLINSNYGVGTKVKIIMDQLMEVEQSKELKQYNEIYDNMKILVVDDNEATFKIIEKMLKGSKIEIDTSLNGKDCLNKIKSKNRYDVILLDEELSQITGEDLLNKLKEIRNYNTPVILLTKDNSYEYNLEYKNMGFDDYIVRPFKREVLLSKLDKFHKK